MRRNCSPRDNAEPSGRKAQGVVGQVEEVGLAEHVLVKRQNNEISLRADRTDGTRGFLPVLRIGCRGSQDDKGQQSIPHEVLFAAEAHQSLSVLGRFFCWRRDFVPVRRLHTKQVVNEVVVAIMFLGQNAYSVVLPGNVQHVEVLVRLDERVDHLQGRRRIDIGVHLPDDDQSFALQTVGVVDVRRCRVLRAREANPSTARSTTSCPCDCRGSRCW